jgi:two-component system response regulator TtrR
MSPLCDVLVVDDEGVVRDAVRAVLEAEGMRVVCFADAETALAHPALAYCKLVICDVMLPGRSGLDAVSAFHNRRPGIPVVLMTGYASSEQAARAAESGATAFLAKPFDDSELLDLVRHVLEPTDAAGKEARP